MGFVAAQPLRWGEDTIAPGDPVPSGEEGRDYAGMLHLGQIREVSDNAGLSDDDLVRKLDAAEKRVKELEAAGPSEAEGPRLVLTDEQRELLVGKGMDGEFSLEQLDAALSDSEDATGDASDDSDDSDDELPAGVTATGGGWYLLADGETKVHGRKALDAALSDS